MPIEIKGYNYEAVDIWLPGDEFSGEVTLTITNDVGTTTTTLNLEKDNGPCYFPTFMVKDHPARIIGNGFGTTSRNIKALSSVDLGGAELNSLISVSNWTDSIVEITATAIPDAPVVLTLNTDHETFSSPVPIKVLDPKITSVSINTSNITTETIFTVIGEDLDVIQSYYFKTPANPNIDTLKFNIINATPLAVELQMTPNFPYTTDTVTSPVVGTITGVLPGELTVTKDDPRVLIRLWEDLEIQSDTAVIIQPKPEIDPQLINAFDLVRGKVTSIYGEYFGDTKNKVIIGQKVYEPAEIMLWEAGRIDLVMLDIDHGTPTISGTTGAASLPITVVSRMTDDLHLDGYDLYSEPLNRKYIRKPELVSCTPDSLIVSETAMTPVTLVGDYLTEGNPGDILVYHQWSDNVTQTHYGTAQDPDVNVQLRLGTAGLSHVWVATSGGISNKIEVPENPDTETKPEIAAPTPVDVSSFTEITVIGANFGASQGAGYVDITPDVGPLTINEWTPAAIKLIVPEGSGEKTMQVTRGDGRVSNLWNLSINGTSVKPVITSPTPTELVNTTRLDIYGSNFTSQGTLEWENSSGVITTVANSETTAWTNTSIVWNTPPAGGDFKLRVITEAGTSNDYAVEIITDAPILKKYSPATVGENDLIVVTGRNLNTKGTITFNGLDWSYDGNSTYGPAERKFHVVSWEDTCIVFRTTDEVTTEYPGAMAVNMKVTNEDGVSDNMRVEMMMNPPVIDGASTLSTGKSGEQFVIIGDRFRHRLILGSNTYESDIRPGTVYINDSDRADIIRTWTDKVIIIEMPPGANSIKVGTNHGITSAHTVSLGGGASTTPEIQTLLPFDQVGIGDELLIAGNNFTAVPGTVLISGRTITNFIEWSTGTIRFIIPTGTITGSKTVSVTNANGTSGAKAVQIISGEPHINSVAPTPCESGQSTILSGKLFGSSSGIIEAHSQADNSIADFPVTSWSNTSITCKTPNKLGAYRLEVRNFKGILSDNAAVVTVDGTTPVINTVTDPVTVGGTITISGTGLDSLGYNELSVGSAGFGKNTALGWTSTSISVIAPALPGIVDVQVKTSKGRSNIIRTTIRSASGGSGGTGGGGTGGYNVALISVTPEYGLLGAQLTLTGEGFGARDLAKSKVLFGTYELLITSWTDKKIVGSIPVSGPTMGVYNVIVRATRGDSNAKPFYIKSGSGPAPAVTAVSPTTCAPKKTIHITGNNFQNITTLNQVFSDGVTFSLRRPIGCRVFLALKATDQTGIELQISSWDNTSIYATVHNQDQQIENKPYFLRVETPYGMSSNQIPLIPQKPRVTSLSNTRVTQGQTLVVYGTDFGNAKGTVAIDDSIDAQFATIIDWEDTNIVCTVPSFGSVAAGEAVPATLMVSTLFGPSNSRAIDIMS